MEPTKAHCNHSNHAFDVTVVQGFDAQQVSNIMVTWGAAKAEILTEILTKFPECRKNPSEFSKRLREYNVEDFHWDWGMKAGLKSGDEYEWFFLVVDDKVQTVCVLHHPRDSKIDGEEIFYVDYVASAFWNRDRPGYTRKFSGLATILLKEATRFFAIKYRAGFSLHSLPKAEDYYRKIGLKDFGIDPSCHMRYFEAEEKIALTFANLDSIGEQAHG